MLGETFGDSSELIIGPPRFSDKDNQVLGHFIPTGTTVACPTYTLHRDRKGLRCLINTPSNLRSLTPLAHNFKDPEEFKPQRWLSDSKIEPHVQDAFVPFSYGPGVCIGKPVALHNIK
jgi:cytochrome P450